MSLYKYVEGRSDGLGVTDKVILKCMCVDGCELDVERLKDEGMNTYFFTFRNSARNNTLNMWEAFKIKCKKIWYIIRGKDYLYFDIEVDDRAMSEFVDGLHKMIKE